MSLECPSCHRVDSIQKVSAIVSSGTTYGTYSGFADGVGYTAHGQIMVNDYIMVSGSNQTELCRWLTPPQQAAKPSSSLFVILVVLMIFSAYPAVIYLISGEVFWSAFWIGTIIVAAIVFTLKQHARKTRLIHIQSQFPRWQRAISKWQQLYYCHRCDGVFLPWQKFLVPKEQMMSLLYTG